MITGVFRHPTYQVVMKGLKIFHLVPGTELTCTKTFITSEKEVQRNEIPCVVGTVWYRNIKKNKNLENFNDFENT